MTDTITKITASPTCVVKDDSIELVHKTLIPTKIVPHNEAKGTDICGDIHTTIIRSDLGCYMRCNDIHNGSNLQIHPLHPSCSGGDHYFACSDRTFAVIGSDYPIYYIVKGNQYREVYDLSSDSEAKTGKLHYLCQGGDFYLAFSKYRFYSIDPIFFIIFVEKGVYRVVSDLETACVSKWSRYDKIKYNLHEKCKRGLYYWAQKTVVTGDIWFRFLKQVDTWGLQIHCTANLTTDEKGYDVSLHRDIINFMPGGLAVTMGSAYGAWKIIWSYDSNKSEQDATVEYNQATKQNVAECIIKRKVGCVKVSTTFIDHNWTISTNHTSEENVGVAAKAYKKQFALSSTYGGRAIDTSGESWTEESEQEGMKLKFSLGEKVCIWQYVLGLGKEFEVLHCKYLKQTNSSSPPDEIPLPPFV